MDADRSTAEAAEMAALIAMADEFRRLAAAGGYYVARVDRN